MCNDSEVHTQSNSSPSEIPTEIVSEAEMALIETALAAAAVRSSAAATLSYSSSPIRRFPSERMLSGCSSTQTARDIEDLSLPARKRVKSSESLLKRFRKKRGLMVTDITAARIFFDKIVPSHPSADVQTKMEWCEKQMEFTLLYGRPKRTHAMKAGSTRHAELEEEVRLEDSCSSSNLSIYLSGIEELLNLTKKGNVKIQKSEPGLLELLVYDKPYDWHCIFPIVKRVEVSIQSAEDSWAVKLMNFIAGANQLLFDGLTREIPVVGLVQGVWMVGVIDEIRMSVTESVKHPLLVDTKTRSRPTLPSEDQKRNARFQLMCYKYLWDDLVTNDFPSTHFFNFFGLDPQCTLSCDVRNRLAESGLNSKTFGELVKYFSDTCHLLPLANEQLLLRYEYQADQSLLGEDQFPYDPNWVKSQMEWCLKFWMGEREANYVSNGEEWKCRFCSFSSKCLMGNQTQKLEDGGQQKCSS